MRLLILETRKITTDGFNIIQFYKDDILEIGKDLSERESIILLNKGYATKLGD